ncbi:hypothetical protein V6N12_048928 [Hibiscus sabdariffa]|uniref:Uncharacterized protein n=1 Tax=Hibiscus sabdariffa TaxID=183260 RepID=A0ABR2EL15_9ROSI
MLNVSRWIEDNPTVQNGTLVKPKLRAWLLKLKQAAALALCSSFSTPFGFWSCKNPNLLHFSKQIFSRVL